MLHKSINFKSICLPQKDCELILRYHVQLKYSLLRFCESCQLSSKPIIFAKIKFRSKKIASTISRTVIQAWEFDNMQIMAWLMSLTFIANKSPVALFLARKTRPKAPLLIGLIISKSSMDVRSLVHGLIGLARKLRTVSSSVELSSSAIFIESAFSSSICPHRSTYFSLKRSWPANLNWI